MSDDLDFIDDGPSRPKNPGFTDPNPAPPSPDGDQAPFNPFANVTVDANQPGLGAPPPAPGPIATSAATVTPGPGQDASDDGARPARRDDLWTCPHCQVGNKPDRSTCRSCGKSPDDPVAKPWFLNPAVIGAAVVALIVLIVIASRLGPDFTLQEAHRDNVTSSVMTDTSPARPGPELDNASYVPRGRIAGVGRVLAVSNQYQNFHGTVTVAVVFGREGEEGGLDGQFTASFDRCEVLLPNRVPARVSFAFIHLLDPDGSVPDIRPGQMISFSGDHGVLEGERNWGTVSTMKDREYLVHPWAGVRIATP